ncbi:MAG: FMN-binding protein [Clostridiales bacterium]|nr:FMN-binding protein [Clostridiales bacterium]
MKIKSIRLSVFLSIVLLVNGCHTNKNIPLDSYTDGTYAVIYSHTDSHGWIPILEMKIKNGLIQSAWMDYQNPSGELKSDDTSYSNLMKATVGITPFEAYKKMNDSLTESQNSSSIDVITGATHSSEFFIEMSKAALSAASTGKTNLIILDMNDTYLSETDTFDEYGWKSRIAITIMDGKIIDVAYETFNENGELRDDSHNSRINNLESQLIDMQSVEFDESIDDEFKTSKTFKKLAAQALETRVPFK